MLLQLGINISEAAEGVIDEGKTSAKWPFNASENKIEDQQQLLEEKSGSRIICPNVRILNGILGLNCLAHYQLLDWVCRPSTTYSLHHPIRNSSFVV